MLGPNVAWWTENAIKFELKLSNGEENKRKTKQKWCGRQNKNDIKFEKYKTKFEFIHEALF